jgi:phenylalanyl-tRNA synthetase beta chain
MDLSKRWLSDHVDLDVTDKEFADKMTLSGSKVESQSCEGSKIKNIVVGHIESITRHENSDHMWVCQVDAGTGENIQIVTGAQNLKEGDYVPAALHHSCIADGREITRGKLRGVMSNGMLCSLSELGLTIHDFPYAIEDGIFVLGDDCDKTVGKDIRDAIGLNDVITEFEITSNRSDCLSVTGLAREAAATFGVPMKTKEPVVPEGSGNVNDIVKVSIQCPDKCYRYTAAAVRNVKVGPSPRWIRERLRASGVRPINNIVDITNFVMLEYGQPMHAYDAKYVHGGNLIARDALPGERAHDSRRYRARSDSRYDCHRR